MENLRNKINVRLVNNIKVYLKWTSKPSYMSSKVFANNLVKIHKSKLALMLNKPAYIEMWVLEFSEMLIYEIYYDFIKIEYGNNSKLLFTDIDTLKLIQ